MTLGARLLSRRNELGYSRRELSKLTGASQIQIVRYEQDENMPTSDVIVRLTKALGVSSDWLLGLTDEMGTDGLTDKEREILTLFRSKTPERQTAAVEIMRWA